MEHAPTGEIPSKYSSPLLAEYAHIIATAGVERGLVGPREVPRLWDRHILNCAVVEEVIPQGSTVADVGTGAGFPGLVLAIVRPDLEVHLVEPLLRRTTFLSDTVAQLGLADRVHVHRARAEKAAGTVLCDLVTSRAVSSLDALTAWSLPLVPIGGAMIAMKGSSVAEELQTHATAIRLAGGDEGEVLQCGAGLVDPPTTVVRIRRVAHAAPVSRRSTRLGSRSTWNARQRKKGAE